MRSCPARNLARAHVSPPASLEYELALIVNVSQPREHLSTRYPSVTLIIPNRIKPALVPSIA